jgi:hypothetical protein
MNVVTSTINIWLTINVTVSWLLNIVRENSSTSFYDMVLKNARGFDANEINRTSTSATGIEAGHYFGRDREKLLTLLRAREFSCTEKLSNVASMFP